MDIGYGIIAGPSVVIAASDFKGEQLTTSQSVTNVLRQVGLVVSIAVCMSLLSSNMAVAKANISNYADYKIAQSDLSNKIKSKMKRKTNSNIDSISKQNSSKKLNKDPINLKKFEVTKRQKQLITEKELINLLAEKGISINEIPKQQQVLLRQKIFKKVNKEIDHKEAMNKKNISLLVDEIHKKSIHEIKSAFLNIYITISYFIVLGLLPITILDKKSYL